jgi:hypothetical protein
MQKMELSDYSISTGGEIVGGEIHAETTLEWNILTARKIEYGEQLRAVAKKLYCEHVDGFAMISILCFDRIDTARWNGTERRFDKLYTCANMGNGLYMNLYISLPMGVFDAD